MESGIGNPHDFYVGGDAGGYSPTDGVFYLQWGRAPNPCRKYHITSDLASARLIADSVLPVLRAEGICHKVVSSPARLGLQNDGDQRGKFITMYTDPIDADVHVTCHHRVIGEVDRVLHTLYRDRRINAEHIPHSRRHGHVFIEAPVGSSGFIFGGFVIDPTT